MSTQPRPAPTVPPSGEGWTVVVNMPLFEKGRDAGKPVGWLNLNTVHRLHWSKRGPIEKLWRKAAYNALLKKRLPKGLPRARVQIEIRCDQHKKRDVAQNYWPTFKRVIDAVQPFNQYTRIGKNGKPELVIEWGVGLIPGDHKDFLDLPEPVEGPTLGRDFKVNGMPVNGQVILHITPLPAETSSP